MSRSRFVAPLTSLLTLENGDTIIVRRRLNVGEQRASFRACYDVVTSAEGVPSLVYDPTRLGPAKVAAYLIDWSLDEMPIRDLDLKGRIAVVENLDTADYGELKDAIDTHEATEIAARLEEKKQERTTIDDPISRSPSAAAGASTGSVS